MNDEIIKTPDGNRTWDQVRFALGMYDRMKKRQAEKWSRRSAISKKAWEKRKAQEK